MISELISVRKLVSPPSRVGPEFRSANAAGLLIASDALTKKTPILISVFVHCYRDGDKLRARGSDVDKVKVIGT